jgi:HTH-type transcriptional regulator / antitoxin HipB
VRLFQEKNNCLTGENLMRQIFSVIDQISPFLQAARKSAGLSQAQLAVQVGVSQSRMSAMELDPASINLGQLLTIFSVLQLEWTVQSKTPIERTAQEW